MAKKDETVEQEVLRICAERVFNALGGNKKNSEVKKELQQEKKNAPSNNSSK